MSKVVINDHRRKEGEEWEAAPGKMFPPPIDPMAATAVLRDTGPAYGQQELMDMVSKRFPRVGQDRFLVVQDFAPTKYGMIDIPDTAQRPSTSGRVCVVHPSCKEVKLGDHVVFAIFAGTSLPLANDARVRAMQEVEVMCWIDDNASATLKLQGEVQ